jgi:hypothetical protein
MTTPLEERMARLEGSYEQIDRRLGRVETLLDQMIVRFESRMEQLENRLMSRMDRMETRINEVDQRVNARIDQLMYWQLGLMAAIAAAILATVLTRLL